MRILTSLLVTAVVSVFATDLAAQKLTIIHTNDTHSQIDPDEETGLGGVLRRKVLIDSIRQANQNTLLIDMGDVVQGTLYFNLFRGEIENRMINELGYDIRILGNHEFDNGVDELAKNWADTKAVALATNYDLSDSPLAPIFKPYLIKEFDGKKVGFIAINLLPKGMISEGNYDGVVYLDGLKAANSTAWHLKHNEGVDMVIALTHIGYAPSSNPLSDVTLAEASEDIDIIIGGHSHTLINPNNPEGSVPHLVADADGDERILVAQTGKAGRMLGVIDIDLDTKAAYSKVIPVDSRLDDRTSPELAAIIEPYRHGVDSLMQVKVGRSAMKLDKESVELSNWVADFIRDRGTQLAGKVDVAISNSGGIRRGLPKGTVTQGQIQSMLPFNNRVVVLEIKGQDLIEAFSVMTENGSNGLSSEADIVYYEPTNEIISATLNGVPVDPEATYHVATIDYLANGGDYMVPLTRAKVLYTAENRVYEDLLDFLRTGPYKRKVIKPENRERMRPVVNHNDR